VINPFTIMKPSIVIVLLSVLLGMSCSKDRTTTVNYWKYADSVHAIRYNVRHSDFGLEILSVRDNAGYTARNHYMDLMFKKFPTANGVYKVVAWPQQADEMRIGMYGYAAGDNYVSADGSGTVDVRMNNNKAFITFRNTWMHALAYGRTDSVLLTGTIAEY